MSTITAKWLRSVNACESQVKLFEVTFGVSAELTPETLAKARAVDLNIAWLAQNPATPPPVLEVLAGDADARVRECVARNPATPPPTLKVLAGDSNVFVRQYVALNSATPPPALEALAGDSDVWVRQWVARNPAWVRWRVAQNPATLAGEP